MSRAGSFEWDLDTGTLDIDEVGLVVLGLDPLSFDSRPESVVKRLAPSERTRIDEAIDDAVVEGRSSFSVRLRIPLGDGEDQWTHVQGRILRDDDRVHRVVGVVRDATVEASHSAFLLDLENRLQRQTSIVERTTSALSHAVTVDDVTAALTGPGGLARLGADGLALGMVENTELNIIALSGCALEAIAELGTDGEPDRSLPLADAVVSGRPRFLTSVSALVRRYPAVAPYAERLRFRAAAYLPLVAQARSVGSLALYYLEPTPFDAEERNLCLGLAAIVAQSLQRAKLFDEEREFATDLQAAMLPRRIQEIEGGEIAVRYHAAWSGRQVGGDWYDVIALPRSRFGIVVGDVQGHDTHAAAIMGQLRIALRAYAAEGHAPSTVLARASRFLAELDTERFATCTYAQVDLASGTVRVVRAGHFGPLVRHADNRVGSPQVRGGLPLGISSLFGDDEYPETRLDLVPGETLVLYTDGLVEEPGADVDVGVRALIHEVSTGPQGAEALADHLSGRLWERWGSADDVALLVLRRSPDPGSPQAPRLHEYIHQADPEGLSDARTMVRQALNDWGMAEWADDAELMTGELLVNVLLHTEGGAVLTLEVLPEPVRRIRLSVQDRSSVWPRRRSPGETATSGRGLLLLDAVAARWGVEPRGEGKAVWCEIGPSKPPGSLRKRPRRGRDGRPRTW